MTSGVTEPPLSEKCFDADCVRRVADGDKNACRLLVDRHLRSIVNFAYRMLGDRSEAEDVAQETFIRLWTNAKTWESRARLTTWLHRVARNLCLDRMRTSRSVDIDSLSDPVDSRPSVLAQMESLRRENAVRQALMQIAERQRAALSLVYYQGMSNRQAADVLDVEVDALESLLARGRRALRQRLHGSFDSENSKWGHVT